MAKCEFFEIPVKDVDRASEFYGKVFDLTFERAEVDGNTMAFFPRAKEAHGALVKGESYTPSTDGVRLYFTVQDMDKALSVAQSIGSAVMYPKTPIPEYGFVAEITDSEGNRLALHQNF